MSRIRAAAALALALTVGGTVAMTAAEDKKVTVTGCVLKGDDGGFLLADQMLSGAPASVPQPRVLYWLKDDDDLEGHTGHRVELTGELEGELQKGQIEIERDGDVVKLEAKSDGRKVKLRLPEAPAAVGTSGSDKEVEINYIVRKLDVEKVKMVSTTCR